MLVHAVEEDLRGREQGVDVLEQLAVRDLTAVVPPQHLHRVRPGTVGRQVVALGWKAKGAVLGAQIWPGLAAHAAGDPVYRSQVETVPPAPATDGALFAPVPAGTGVRGGARTRMKRQDTARGAR